MSRLFASDDQNFGASALASFLAVNIQGMSPLRLTGLIDFFLLQKIDSFPLHPKLCLCISIWHW